MTERRKILGLAAGFYALCLVNIAVEQTFTATIFSILGTFCIVWQAGGPPQ